MTECSRGVRSRQAVDFPRNGGEAAQWARARGSGMVHRDAIVERQHAQRHDDEAGLSGGQPAKCGVPGDRCECRRKGGHDLHASRTGLFSERGIHGDRQSEGSGADSDCRRRRGARRRLHGLRRLWRTSGPVGRLRSRGGRCRRIDLAGRGIYSGRTASGAGELGHFISRVVVP